MNTILLKSVLTVLLLDGAYCLTDIKIGIVLPNNYSYSWNQMHVFPAMEIAAEHLIQNLRLPINITFYIINSGCSETKGPLAATWLYESDRVHVLFGPVCPYALAPVARFSTYWNLPLITAGGQFQNFDDKSEYKLLTRIYETYSDAADSVIALMNMFNWTTVGLIYEDTKDSSAGKSECFFRMEAIFKKIKQEFPKDPWYVEVGSLLETDLERMLRNASLNARIFVLCGSADSVRQLMITAHDLGFDNGEYVFLNIDQDESIHLDKRPWYLEKDTDERNQKARKAYETLLTISPPHLTDRNYKGFLDQVQNRSRAVNQGHEYIDTRKTNWYIGAFYDAVILYGLAINETIAAGDSITDGHSVTKRMWNRTFQGITGMVTIDANGDRTMDYSLLDMNTATGEFEVVKVYVGYSKIFEHVRNKPLYWGSANNTTPLDEPTCGFDNSKCTTNGGSTTNSTTKQKVASLLANFQQSLTDISAAVEDLQATLNVLTDFLKDETDPDIDSSE